jgi:hypothetical protein
MDILTENALIGTSVLTTSADLSRVITSITSASVLENIVNFDLPFAPNKKLVHQALQGVQRGQGLKAIPLHNRTKIDKILHDF